MTTRPHSQPIPKLYEDEFFVVFDKPSRLLVIPTPAGESRTLVSIVNEHYVKEGMPKLHPCHRLDRDTSGVIIFAKGKHHQQAMMALFEARQVQKKYFALIHGRLSDRAGEFRSAISDFDAQRFQKNAVAKMAVTRYKEIEARRGYSFVEIDLLTGRTNQIRIHFAEAGHPLLGERKYAFGRDHELKFRRVALHAATVCFRHPVTAQTVQVTSELPEDMKGLLAKGLSS